MRAAMWDCLTAIAVLILFAPPVRAQTPTTEEFNNQVRSGMDAQAVACQMGVSCGGGQSPVTLPLPHIDPCYIKQNAMRPCRPEPAGVDRQIIGTWKLPLKGGSWVMEVGSDGSYKFHSEAGDGVLPHSGTFSARNANWSLKASNGYADGGYYVYQSPDTWIATGSLGVGAWRRPASINNTMRPCPSGQRHVSKAGVDPEIVGTWELPLKGGPWVLEIGGDGTYKFHSESGDAAPANSGDFSANNGRWSLKATTGYADSGLYKYQAPDTWIVAGKLGVAAWRRPKSAAVACY